MTNYIKEYGTVLADPPWPYDNKDGPRAAPDHRPNSWDGVTGAVGSSIRYGSMPIDGLCSLQIPVAEQAHLYLWTTNAFLVEAHEVAKAWGFAPKTMLTWGKVKSDGTPSMKAGYYYRGATEHVLFGVRGTNIRLAGPPTPTLFLSRRLAHSVKPAWIYEIAETHSPAPRLELFARAHRLGWDVWGNEVENNAMLEEQTCTPDAPPKWT